MAIPEELLARQVRVIGPKAIMYALLEIGSAAKNDGHAYAGAFDMIGSGDGRNDRTKLVRLQMREGVTPEDARWILGVALDRLAQEHGLEAERDAVEVMLPEDWEAETPDDE